MDNENDDNLCRLCLDKPFNLSLSCCVNGKFCFDCFSKTWVCICTTNIPGRQKEKQNMVNSADTFMGNNYSSDDDDDNERINNAIWEFTCEVKRRQEEEEAKKANDEQHKAFWERCRREREELKKAEELAEFKRIRIQNRKDAIRAVLPREKLKTLKLIQRQFALRK